MVTVESVREYLLLWVEMVQDHIRVRRTAGGKDDYLCDFDHFVEELLEIGPDPDSSLDGRTVFDGEVEFDSVALGALVRVDEALVQIKINSLLKC